MDENSRDELGKREGCIMGVALTMRMFVYLLVLLLTLVVSYYSANALWSALFGASAVTALEVETLTRLLMLLPLFYVAYLILKYAEGLTFSRFGLPLRRGWGRECLKGLAVATFFYIVGFGFLYAVGEVQISSLGFNPQALLFSWLFMLSVSLTEELIYRSVILGSMLNAGVNRPAALLISALLFSLSHLFNDGFSAISFLNIWLAGVLLGIPYIYTRNLWYAVSLHLFWNWLQGAVLGFGVSGNRPSDSLLRLHLPENNLLNGGVFGFEGSLVCTFLLLLVIAVTWRRASARFASVPNPRSTPSHEQADARTPLR